MSPFSLFIMQLLKKRIQQDGRCFEGGILKVDSFINHQMDPVLMKSIGVEFVRRFAATNVNKIMTIEASGCPRHHDRATSWTSPLYLPKRNRPKPFRTH